MKRPFFVLGIITILSVLMYYFFGFLPFVLFASICLVLSCIFVAKTVDVIFYVVMLITFILSIIRIDNNISKVAEIDDSKTLKFTVVSEMENTQNAQKVIVKSNDNESIKNGTKFNLYFRNCEFNCGEVINADVSLLTDDDNKYNISNISKQIYGNFWLKNYTKTNEISVYYSTINKIRNYINKTFDKYLSGESREMVSAIFLGNKSALSDSFTIDVRRCGMSHAMVVSGLHLSIIMGFLFFIADRLFYNKYLRFLLILVSLFLICSVCGFSPSILRASLIFLLFALAPIFDREGDPLNILGASVFLMLAFEPMLIFNIAFQMSLLSYFAVIYITPLVLGMIYSKVKLRHFIVKYLIDAIVVSVLAQLFTAPITIYNFGYISLISSVVNVLVSFFITLLLVLTLCGILFSKITFMGKGFFFITDLASKYIVSAIKFFSEFKYSAIKVPQVTSFYAAIIILVLLLIVYRNRGEEYADY